MNKTVTSDAFLSRQQVTGLAVLVAASIAIFYDAFESMWEIWTTHNTYMYAFLVPLITAYIIWLRRDALVGLAVVPSPIMLLLFVVPVTGWFVALQLQILEGMHLSVMLFIVVAMLTFLGSDLTRVLWFPIAYLVLMAPTGTPVLPFLQWITTKITLFFLNLVGMDYYAEGFSILVTSGEYFVAPGCGGLNFLLAAIAFCLLFSVVNFRSLRTRFIYSSVCIASVIFLNGVRVFGIIGIAHISGEHLSIVDDHLFYGWLFFSFALLVMAWVGARYVDHDGSFIGRVSPSAVEEQTISANAWMVTVTLITLFLAVLMAYVAPLNFGAVSA